MVEQVGHVVPGDLRFVVRPGPLGIGGPDDQRPLPRHDERDAAIIGLGQDEDGSAHSEPGVGKDDMDPLCPTDAERRSGTGEPGHLLGPDPRGIDRRPRGDGDPLAADAVREACAGDPPAIGHERRRLEIVGHHGPQRRRRLEHGERQAGIIGQAVVVQVGEAEPFEADRGNERGRPVRREPAVTVPPAPPGQQVVRP